MLAIVPYIHHEYDTGQILIGKNGFRGRFHHRMFSRTIPIPQLVLFFVTSWQCHDDWTRSFVRSCLDIWPCARIKNGMKWHTLSRGQLQFLLKKQPKKWCRFSALDFLCCCSCRQSPVAPFNFRYVPQSRCHAHKLVLKLWIHMLSSALMQSIRIAFESASSQIPIKDRPDIDAPGFVSRCTIIYWTARREFERFTWDLMFRAEEFYRYRLRNWYIRPQSTSFFVRANKVLDKMAGLSTFVHVPCDWHW